MKFLPTLPTDTIFSWIKNSPPYCIILENCATFKSFTIGRLRPAWPAVQNFLGAHEAVWVDSGWQRCKGWD